MRQADRYFLWLYIKNLIIVRYRGAYLGLVWNVLQPLIYLIILGVVFATFNNASLEDFIVYLFAGLVPWRFFEQSVLSMIDSILLNAQFTKKIKISYYYFPIIQLGVAFVDFLCAFGVLILIFLMVIGQWHVQMIVLPFSIFIWLMISAGSGLLMATLFVFFQDIKNIVQMFLMLLMFTSTIFFKAEVFETDPMKRVILQYDPVCYWVNLFQKPIYYGQWPSIHDWLVSVMSGLVLLGCGIYVYNKKKDTLYYYL